MIESSHPDLMVEGVDRLGPPYGRPIETVGDTSVSLLGLIYLIPKGASASTETPYVFRMLRHPSRLEDTL